MNALQIDYLQCIIFLLHQQCINIPGGAGGGFSHRFRCFTLIFAEINNQLL